MRSSITLALLAFLSAAASACSPVQERGEAAAPVTSATPAVAASGPQAPYAAIAADETIRFTGTEPFWGGTVSGGEMVYSTPEDQAGQTIAVRRFAGNNGLGFSGTLEGVAVDMTVTPGACSDGMSDRTYPFTVTLKLGAEQRNGCAWSDRSPFTGSQRP